MFLITSFLLMASRRSSTTSSPSQSVALKPLVQVTRIPCRKQDHQKSPQKWFLIQRERTASRLVWWQGKEKVKPSGRRALFMPM